MSNAYDRARASCYQDQCEGVPFASVGGLEHRQSMTAPDYIKPEDHDEYLRGYRDMARELYGDDFETCNFTWTHVLTIEDKDE